MIRRFTILSLALVLNLGLAGVARAQNQLSGVEILQQVAGVYGHMKTLKATGHMVTETATSGMSNKLDAAIVIELAQPGKMRFEVQNAATGNVTVITDGHTVWMSMPQLNSYSKLALPAGSTDTGEAAGAMPGANIDLAGLAENVEEARVLRSESVTVNGQPVDCYVIKTTYQPSAGTGPATIEARSSTLWIDKSRFVVVRFDSLTKTKLGSATQPTESHQNLQFDTLDLDVPLDDSLFTFTPPAGARQVDLSQFMPKPAAPPAAGPSSPPQ